MIPKFIFQTYKSVELIPSEWKDSAPSIRRHMPLWEYKFFSDSDIDIFVKEHFPHEWTWFTSLSPKIIQIDVFRCMVLYVRGGVYMDMDYIVERSVDDLFADNNDLYLVSSGNLGSYITNSFMASKPGHKLWLHLIEEAKKPLPWYANYIHHFKIMETAGPAALTRTVRKYAITYSALPSLYILPCSACEIGTPRCKTSPFAYLKQLSGGSWNVNAIDTIIINAAICNLKLLIVVAILLFIIMIVVLFLFIFGVF